MKMPTVLGQQRQTQHKLLPDVQEELPGQGGRIIILSSVIILRKQGLWKSLFLLHAGKMLVIHVFLIDSIVPLGLGFPKHWKRISLSTNQDV